MIQFTRVVLCRACSTKHTVEEVNGQYPVLNCKKCKEVLFYQHHKKGILASNLALIFASEELFQQQKSVLKSNLKEEFIEDEEGSE